MSDDLLRQKAELLFRKFGLIQDVIARTAATSAREPQFKKDFLAEVQNAARELATKRRGEIEQRIADLDERILEAERRHDLVAVDRLRSERNQLQEKIPLD